MKYSDSNKRHLEEKVICIYHSEMETGTNNCIIPTPTDLQLVESIQS